MSTEQPGTSKGAITTPVTAVATNSDGEQTVTIQCPYCHQPHQHAWPADTRQHHYQAPCKDRNAQRINGGGYFAQLPPKDTSQ